LLARVVRVSKQPGAGGKDGASCRLSPRLQNKSAGAFRLRRFVN